MQQTAMFISKIFRFAAQKQLDVENWELDTKWVKLKDLCLPRLDVIGSVTQFQRPKSENKFDLIYFNENLSIVKSAVRTNTTALNSSKNYFDFTEILA